MKSRISIFAVLFFITIGIAVSYSPVFAVENVDEQYPTVGKQPAVSVEEKILGDIIPTLVRKKIGALNIDVTASLSGGYDSNVNLNRYDKDGSVFMQGALGIYGKYPIKDSVFTLRGGYDLTSITYFKFSDPDLLDNTIGLGVDARIADNYLWSFDYMADFVGYPHDELSEYTLNQIGTTLRQDITKWLYQKIGYEFFYKHYPRLKTRNNHGNFFLGDRRDCRNSVIHQLGLYVGDRMLIKTENRFYNNDSNEQYLRYYDYNALKSKVSLTYLITKKLYETMSFGYQYKAYNKRGVSDKDGDDQRDHLFIYGASVFYDVIPSVSVGVNFDCRKNYSNENMEKYEDYVISSGVYCSF